MTPEDFKHCFPAFQTLSQQDAEVLLNTVKARDIAPETELIHSGSKSDALYLIVDGRMRINLEADGESVVLGDVAAGQWVGEMGMIEPAAASATVVAVERTSLLRLSHEDFMALREDHPTLSSTLLKVFSDHLAERLRSTLHLVDTGEAMSGDAATREARRNWFIGVAQRIMGLAARTGA